MTELREWYKASGICVACGQEDAVQGQLRCSRCREKVREANRKHYAQHREELNEQNKQRGRARTVERRNQGICTRCGKRKPETGRAMCNVCRAEERRKWAKQSRRKGLLPRYMFGNGDYCSTCGKPVNGTKLCPKCKADAQRTIEIARQHIQSGWRYETFVFGKKSL